MTVKIEPATPAHARYVGRHLRRADVVEVWALDRLSQFDAPPLAVAISDEAYAALDEAGEPVAVFGVYLSALGEEGSPWLLGTPNLRRHRADLMRYTAAFVRHLFTDRGLQRLSNCVHAENVEAIRYLRHAGFDVSKPYTGPTGARACDFTMERPDV